MMSTHRSVLSGLALIVALSACNLGKTGDRVTLRTLAPGMMRTTDIKMACAVGQTMTPVLMALGQDDPAKKEPHKALVLTLVSAGMCSEMDAWEATLAGLQARHVVSSGGDGRQWGPLMQDALVREQRAHEEAAQRNFAAYQQTFTAFGAPDEYRACPAELKPREELVFLLGLMAGVLAVIHDAAAEKAVGVSSAVPRLVERGAGCLDDASWWSVPSALRAAVWASVPGAAPAGVDAWQTLEQSVKQSEARGMWLARALQVQTAHAAGKTDLLRAAIEAHGAATQRGPGNAEYALLNAYASQMIRFYSDLLWMASRGHRTPLNGLGTLPAADGAAAVPNIDELVGTDAPTSPGSTPPPKAAASTDREREQ
jgi:hypothetical protein